MHNLGVGWQVIENQGNPWVFPAVPPQFPCRFRGKFRARIILVGPN